ncbi:MAG: hypothetical protein RBT63_01830 [Bdellovibrionales bacterium]|nr:hypothetical protein [Bdellovibrionales bacterium]
MASPVAYDAATLPKVLSDPLAMTLTQVLALPGEKGKYEGRVTALPARAETFLFEEHRENRFRAFLQRNPQAPLVFIIPGTAGNSNSSVAHFIAEKMFRLGYHAVTLDNPFSWTFAVSGSESAVPGYAPHDAEDLYRVMRLAEARLRAERGVSPASYGLVGYSLGALQSVFLKKIDDREGRFSFEKTLLIHPPLDLLHALSVIDGFYDEGHRLSAGAQSALMGRIAAFAEKYLTGGRTLDLQDTATLDRVFSELRLTQREIKYLIGQNFREGLRDVIFSSQQVRDLGILKKKVTRFQRNDRMAEAKAFSFLRYVDLFILPTLKLDRKFEWDRQDLNHATSLYQFEDYLRTEKDVFVLHAKDDFILNSNDAAWIQDVFGDRAQVLPFGGHGGTMVLPQFTSYLKEIF